LNDARKKAEDEKEHQQQLDSILRFEGSDSFDKLSEENKKNAKKILKNLINIKNEKKTESGKNNDTIVKFSNTVKDNSILIPYPNKPSIDDSDHLLYSRLMNNDKTENLLKKFTLYTYADAADTLDVLFEKKKIESPKLTDKGILTSIGNQWKKDFMEKNQTANEKDAIKGWETLNRKCIRGYGLTKMNELLSSLGNSIYDSEKSSILYKCSKDVKDVVIQQLKAFKLIKNNDNDNDNDDNNNEDNDSNNNEDNSNNNDDDDDVISFNAPEPDNPVITSITGNTTSGSDNTDEEHHKPTNSKKRVNNIVYSSESDKEEENYSSIHAVLPTSSISHRIIDINNVSDENDLNCWFENQTDYKDIKMNLIKLCFLFNKKDVEENVHFRKVVTDVFLKLLSICKHDSSSLKLTYFQLLGDESYLCESDYSFSEIEAAVGDYPLFNTAEVANQDLFDKYRKKETVIKKKSKEEKSKKNKVQTRQQSKSQSSLEKLVLKKNDKEDEEWDGRGKGKKVIH